MRFRHLSRLLLALGLWTGPALAAAAEKLTLFQTGNTGGLASCYRYDIELPYALAGSFLQQQGEQLGFKDFGVSGNAIPFYARQNYLWGKGFGIRQLRGFLAHPPEVLMRQPVTLLQTRDSLIVDPDRDQQLMQRVQASLLRTPNLRDHFHLQQAELIRYVGGVMRLRLRDGDETLAASSTDWELLIGFELGFRQKAQTDSLMVIGQPMGEGSRRMELIEQLRGPGDLLVDSGNLLEGLSSVVTNRLSYQRENSLKMAQALHYFAVNVGKNELLGGVDSLRQEAETYGLPLISASLRQKGEYVFEPYKIVRTPQFRLALIGIGDNLDFETLRSAGVLPADTEVLTPQAALEQALQKLRASEDVEFVGVLSNLPRAELQKLLVDHADLQLLLANSEAPLQHVRESLKNDNRRQARPLMVSSNPFAVSMLEISSEGDDIELSAEELPVNFAIPPERRFLPAIMAIRHKAYEDALEPLIPDLGAKIGADAELAQLFLDSQATREALGRFKGVGIDRGAQALSTAQLRSLFPPYLTAELLANLEMNGLIEAFGAEVMALRLDEGMELTVPGPMSRLLLYERIRSGDTLERYFLNGEQLKKLLALKLPGLVFAGASPEKSQVWGRDIGDKRSVYRVLIPSSLAGQSAARPLLAGLRHESLLSNPFRPSSAPAPVYLRDAVLGLIESIARRPDAETEFLRLLRPSWKQRRLTFTVQFDNLQLNLSGYNAYNNKAYSEVRETRVISPNSFTFGGRSRLALGLDNAFFGLTTSASAKYEGLSVLDESTTKDKFSENQDDLTFAAELELRVWEFSLFGSQLVLTPYLESDYDTEFTPTINKTTQRENPRQSEWRTVAGLSIPPAGNLKTFKTGLAVRRDFNVPDNLEIGLDGRLIYNQPLSPSIAWNNDLSLRYFLPSPKDNASSLGLVAQLVSSVNFSLTDNLSLKLYADGYLFQGKLPSTSQLGASVILGVGLGFDRFWKPVYEPLLPP